MDSFTPPYPPRPSRTPAPMERYALARKNLIGIWEEAAFKIPFEHARLLGRHVVLCNSPESVQFAFGTHNASFERKSPQMRQMLEPLIGDGLFISDGEVWRKRRRLVQPILHLSRLREFGPMMVETAREARERWAAQGPDQPLDILKEMGQLTAEIICRTIFGRTLGRRYTQEIVEGFADYQRAVDVFDLRSALGLPGWLPRKRSREGDAAAARIHAVLDRVFADIEGGDGGAETSLLGQLMHTGEPATSLTRQEARNEACVLFMAGYETTANTLAWTWYLLSQDAAVEAKLHREIDTVLQGRPPELGDLARLSWTRAVIEEALRLYPPVPVLSREALAEERFEGERIPKGAVVLVVPWLLHRHKLLWSKPDMFKPQRFLPGGSAEKVSKYAYLPFSVGPRVCPGLSLGLTEAILCVATLAQGFRLRLQPGHVVEPVCRITLRPGDALPMLLEARPVHAAVAAPC